MPETKSSSLLAKRTGFVLVFAGLACNEWMLAYFLSPDRQFVLTTQILILMADFFLIGSGIFLISIQSFSRLFLIYASLLLTLFVLEQALSRYFDLAKQLFVVNSNGTGSYRLKPNLHIQRRIGDATYLFSTNSHGMPWREVKKENPEQKIRIAFVGDSFTFGCCASRVEKSFVGVFDREIAPEYEVLNFGVVGFGLADEKLMIEEEVLSYHPKYILLMFYSGNDFSDTLLSLGPNGKILGPKGRSLYDRMDIPPKPTFAQRRTRWITNMATFRLLNEILIGREDPVKFNSDPNRFDSWTYWSRRSYLPSGIRAKDLSLQILKQIVEICDQNHIQLVIAALPNMGQVYAPALLTEDMDYGLPQKYVEEFSKTYSVPYFDLLPPLRNYVQQTHRNIYMGVDVHFNDEGHGLAGRLLFDDFMQLLSEQHVPVFLRETP